MNTQFTASPAGAVRAIDADGDTWLPRGADVWHLAGNPDATHGAVGLVSAHGPITWLDADNNPLAVSGVPPFRPLPWAMTPGEMDSDLPVDDTPNGGVPCGARGPHDFRCTMRPGHDNGFHRAGTGVAIVAEWATA